MSGTLLHDGRDCGRGRRFWAFVVVVLAVLVGCARDAAAASRSFMADCKALTSGAHRLTGTREYERAAAHVESRLREIGVDTVVVQEFTTPQTVVKRCEMTIAGKAGALRLLPMRANVLMAPVTPPGGISGPIHHVGRGRAKDYGTRAPKGAIVVLHYNSGAAWLRAFRMGAKAVIFVRHGVAESRNLHYVNANANLPRFYYAGKASDLPDGAVATVYSTVVWETVIGRNVLGLLRGTQPRLGLEQEEVVVLAAHLDSFGEVPRASPGARGAANCAALLEAAAFLRHNRPRRHVLIAFFDAQARAHAGATSLYRALEREDKSVLLENRTRYLEVEAGFLEKITELLAMGRDESLQARVSPVWRDLVVRLKEKGEIHANDESGILIDLNTKLGRARKAGRASSELAGLEQEIEFRRTEKAQWNQMRRALGRDQTRAEEIAELVGKKLRGAGSLSREALDSRVKTTVAGILKKLDLALREVAEDVATRKEELGVMRRVLQTDRAVREMFDDAPWISLHVSFLFGDTTERWGLIIGGDTRLHWYKDSPGLYRSIQGCFLAGHRALEARGRPCRRFEAGSADGTINQTRSLWAAPMLTHSGEMAGRLGIYNLVLSTCQENVPREGTPDDTLGRLEAERIERQMAEAAALLAEVASSESLSLRRSIGSDVQYFYPTFEGDNREHGATVMGRTKGSAVANKPMAGAVVAVRLRRTTDYWYEPLKAYAFDDFFVLRTNRNGIFSFGPVRNQARATTVFGFAAAFDEHGQVTDASDLPSEIGLTKTRRLTMFRCADKTRSYQGAAFCVARSVQKSPLRASCEADVIGAESNGTLDTNAYFDTSDGVISWFCEPKEKRIKLFALQGMVLLNNGDEALEERHERLGRKREYRGRGLASHGPAMVRAEGVETPLPPDSTRRAAADLWRLDEGRMKMLRSCGVTNSSIEELQGRSEDLLIEARNTREVARAESLAASSFLASAPVYTEVRETLDDLVVAVLVLLALSVPFAFALERLLVGATNVYRQIMWFAIFFAATFLVLFFSHPAFAISKSSIIIFLGFVVVVLSTFVIVIIMRKFEVELKVLQGLTSTVHAADVSRFGTIMAAMSMGISTMRRRPLRTVLTAVTIILLTFTILCFASFGTQKGIIRLFIMPSPPYAGVFLHQVNWSELSVDLLDLGENRWGGETVVCPRYWVSMRGRTSVEIMLSRADGTRLVPMKGVLGISRKELAKRADLARLLQGGSADDTSTIWMSRAVADRLDVAPGDAVRLRGIALRVGALLDPLKVVAAKDMDGSDILPVDFTEMRSVGAREEVIEDPLVIQQRQNWTSLSVDSVVIVSAEVARDIGGMLHGLTLYTADSKAAELLADDVARIVPFPVNGTRQDGVYRHLLGARIEASGAGDLLFPTLLGGLVIFGTMLGSVADREREIYTFSALGLAPPHVAGLFFAEAMVYSVIGGLGGYLLAQGTLKVLGYLAAFGLVRVPEMNYSSTNAVVAILIVMATVLLSAVYPAMKASRSANPGVLRSWRLPAPQGDRFDITFPFTVSEYDITGVVSFLKEHFDNFGDTGLGVFMARDTELERRETGALGLVSHVALAPFDLGVTQAFEMYSAPSEIPGIDEIKIALTRTSGQPKDWRRLNKVLLDDLRRQFLIWRSLPQETMELYRQRTLTSMEARATTA